MQRRYLMETEVLVQMFDESVLKRDERAIFALRSLYRRYGYLPYRMSKFEEYSLYLKNKDFLVSDRVITFNDTNGTLLALKPDVTISIIKSTETAPGTKRKVFYNENVYRVSKTTHRYKEIMQTGLECIGDLTRYDVFEVIKLAAESLSVLSEPNVLQISHQGLLNKAIAMATSNPTFQEQALIFIEAKNEHDLARLCDEYGVGSQSALALQSLVRMNGSVAAVVPALAAVFGDEAQDELTEIAELAEFLENAGLSSQVVFDFSIVNNMNYYSGFVFKGYLDGVSEGVLSGGEYGKMMGMMGKGGSAIGFAIYLDVLDQLQRRHREYDIDVLVLHDADATSASVAAKIDELVGQGLSVSAQCAIPEKLRFRELVDMRADGEGEKSC